MREEKLEIQVWLTSRGCEEKVTMPHKRDKFVGSAFINLFPLLDGDKSHSHIRYLIYPQFIFELPLK